MSDPRAIHRVTRQRPCPICQKPDYCSTLGDDPADPDGVICMRVEAGRPTRNGGWLHWLRNQRPGQRLPRRIVIPLISAAPPVEIAEMSSKFQQDAGAFGTLAKLGAELGLSVESMRRFGVGYCQDQHCSTWPMADADGRVVGINRRFADGSKKLFPRHHAALYMPVDLPGDLQDQQLLIAEGATDAVAALDFGSWSVGRFSCSHGADLLKRLVKARRPAGVVIVADRDAPGQRGAGRLASDLLPYVGRLKVICPPGHIKDLRAWKRAGLTVEELQQVIEQAPVRRLNVEVRNG